MKTELESNESEQFPMNLNFSMDAVESEPDLEKGHQEQTGVP